MTLLAGTVPVVRSTAPVLCEVVVAVVLGVLLSFTISLSRASVTPITSGGWPVLPPLASAIWSSVADESTVGVR